MYPKAEGGLVKATRRAIIVTETIGTLLRDLTIAEMDKTLCVVVNLCSGAVKDLVMR